MTRLYLNRISIQTSKLLVYLPLLIAVSRAASSMPTITVESIDSANIHIHSFTSPQFQQALDPGRDTTLDGLLEYSVLLTNDSEKQIVAYSVRWLFTAADGTTTKSEVTVFDFSHFPSPSSSELPPHKSIFVTNVGPARSVRDPRVLGLNDPQMIASFRAEKDIHIALAAVLFDDGSSDGKDPGAWISRWRAHMEAERDLFREAVTLPEDQLQSALANYVSQASEVARPIMAGLGTTKSGDFNPGQLFEAYRHAMSYEDQYAIYKGFKAVVVQDRLGRAGLVQTRKEMQVKLAERIPVKPE
jgi:hypothetical protein